jgi:hypothetical protein
MNPRLHCALPALLLFPGPCARAQVKVELVPDQAEAVLAILAQETGAADWPRLFHSEGYQRLAEREAAFKRPLAEDTFKAFVLGPDLRQAAPDLARTLATWRSADLTGCARKALAYLPEGARIEARVYPVIKPRSNSFVFKEHLIFLYLDPNRTQAQFENTVVHEFHHIGLGSLKPEPKAAAELERLPASARAAADWLSAFGEGFAMLAAAGGPEVHPHAQSPAADQERWDRDLAQFDPDLKRVETFLLEVAEGRLTGEAIQDQGMAFFGVQGPWYTVGWRMASTIERQLGRPALLACMRDPRQLLPRYNQAATMAGTAGARWSERLMAELGVTERVQPGLSR